MALSRLGSPPARAGGDRPGWTALAAVVVLGIVGMHAIGLHGSQHTDPGALAAPSATVAHSANMEAHGQVDVAVAALGEGAPLVSPLDLGHGMAGMAMLCIAVLVGAALARMLIRSRRGSSVPLRERVTTSTRVDRRTDPRQTGPPLVWAFSVIRC